MNVIGNSDCQAKVKSTISNNYRPKCISGNIARDVAHTALCPKKDLGRYPGQFCGSHFPSQTCSKILPFLRLQLRNSHLCFIIIISQDIVMMKQGNLLISRVEHFYLVAENIVKTKSSLCS